jgi:hypothetical protein
MNHDYATYDVVTQQTLLAEFGEALPIRDFEGPISARGDYLMNLMGLIQTEDPNARMRQPYNGDYQRLQDERPVRIFTTLSSKKLVHIEDLVSNDLEQLEEVS